MKAPERKVARVLVVDCDAGARARIEQMLGDECEFVSASDQEAAFELAAEFLPDLVLLNASSFAAFARDAVEHGDAAEVETPDAESVATESVDAVRSLASEAEPADVVADASESGSGDRATAAADGAFAETTEAHAAIEPLGDLPIAPELRGIRASAADRLAAPEGSDDALALDDTSANGSGAEPENDAASVVDAPHSAADDVALSDAEGAAPGFRSHLPAKRPVLAPGLAICRALRSGRVRSGCRIILISDRTSKQDRFGGYQAGADDYLPSPVERDELLSKIRMHQRLQSIEVARDDLERMNCELAAANASLLFAREEALRVNAELQRTNARLAEEVSLRRTAENQLRHDAFHDVLTDLPNRALIIQEVQRSIARLQRTEDYVFAVAFIDLDDFKVVNDSLGHRAGDDLLIEIARRLRAELRATDVVGEGDMGTAARIGGDEFVVLMDGLSCAEDALLIAERILESVARPVDLGEQTVTPSLSMGLALGTPEYTSADELLRDADTALYRAKESGKRRVAIFDSEMRNQAVKRLALEVELRRAIEADRIDVHYQPIFDMASQRIRGFEALARWDHPMRGTVRPSEFIGLAEESGLMHALGKLILRKACRDTRRWRTDFPGRENLWVNVNVSGLQLEDGTFAKLVDEALTESGLDRSALNLELTESVLMRGRAAASGAIAALAELGTNIQLDDFGTGFSSLSSLSDLPISALKLDHEFISAGGRCEADRVTVRSVLEMAHVRGLKVVAEGVETAEQMKWLRDLGCDFVQGYFLSPPLSAKDVDILLGGGTPKRRVA
ncbi:Cyclic di-GMP phosphodiesterase Gmr [Planctomycetes bacterium Pla163]|uniref:Cyclic di-GMP phosphodiesterase Gmr n=1 Tax=Rohdeia mirabilis TaxID=2528008 RepID=A0A518CZK1_9BACT|nr:Cyclic di-GMP phosphodiesterase Gmr [Planctomycetes bacterium Pla163]